MPFPFGASKSLQRLFDKSMDQGGKLFGRGKHKRLADFQRIYVVLDVSGFI